MSQERTRYADPSTRQQLESGASKIVWYFPAQVLSTPPMTPIGLITGFFESESSRQGFQDRQENRRVTTLNIGPVLARKPGPYWCYSIGDVGAANLF